MPQYRHPESSTAAVASTGFTTDAHVPVLTELRKEVLVALVAGYLQSFPRYDPRPRTYAEVAAAVDLPRSTVMKRIEAVRTGLVAAGVPGLEEPDARRPLAEWLLSMRLITSADLDWLAERVRGRGSASPAGEVEE